MLCEAVHRNPNLKLFSYSTSFLASKFSQKLLGVHVYTHVPLLDPPLLLFVFIFFIKEKVAIWLRSSVFFCEVFGMLYVIPLCTDCFVLFMLFPGFSDHW